MAMATRATPATTTTRQRNTGPTMLASTSREASPEGTGVAEDPTTKLEALLFIASPELRPCQPTHFYSRTFSPYFYRRTSSPNFYRYPSTFIAARSVPNSIAARLNPTFIASQHNLPTFIAACLVPYSIAARLTPSMLPALLRCNIIDRRALPHVFMSHSQPCLGPTTITEIKNLKYYMNFFSSLAYK